MSNYKNIINVHNNYNGSAVIEFNNLIGFYQR